MKSYKEIQEQFKAERDAHRQKLLEGTLNRIAYDIVQAYATNENMLSISVSTEIFEDVLKEVMSKGYTIAPCIKYGCHAITTFDIIFND